MNTVVIDASMAANWELGDEKNEAANQILEDIKQQRLITTSLFWHEVRSIFLSSEKRGRTSKGESLQLINHLRALGIREQTDDDDALILSLATEHDLSAYDAAYLALALSQQATLATNDRKLAHAAVRTGLPLRTALGNLPGPGAFAQEL